jgi:thiopeptide-type bacteriocin biosynthesis protein
MTAAGNQQAKDKNRAAPSLYDPLDFVVVRAPLLPVEFYRAISSSHGDESLRVFLDNEQVLSAINAASPALARALLCETTNEKDRARAKRKLRRYLIRMSTRPTPFGAFAGVGIATLGQRTTLRIEESEARLCRRLDVPWLLDFAHKLESDPDIFRQLKLQANPCALERGGRVYLRELNPLRTNGKAIKNASLKATAMVRGALNAARMPITCENLSSCLAGCGNASEEKIQHFITELWRQEFLLTDLRPPFTNGDPARYLLQRLKDLRGGATYALKLQRQFEVTDLDGLREPASRAKPPKNEFLDTEGKRLVHIDAVFSTKGELNVSVAKEAARAAEILLKITPWPAGLSYLQAYRRVFEDRYGTDREVPLLEMIDREYGIGFPPVYDGGKTPPDAEHTAALRIRRETLFDIARRANDECRIEIELDEETLQRLHTSSPSPRTTPVSLEINVFVSAASARDLDEGRFTVVVGPNVGAMEGGRSLGRFAESLGPAGMKAYRDAAQAREAASSGQQCVELNYLPRNLQLTNILARPATHTFELNVGLQPGVPLSRVIPLHDLAVGVRGGRFYVKSLKLNRALSICSGSMANIDFAPAICRLLTELMLDGIAMLSDFEWGVASMYQFLPRVRCGRAVLSVAKWRISDLTMKREFCLHNDEAFRASVAVWRSRWNVPRHVHLTEGDNRLVLDLENDMDLEDLRSELRQLSPDRALILEEVYPNVEDAWLPGTNGRFVAEYVVPMVQNGHGLDRQGAAKATVATQKTATACRVKTPGSDWLYIKLYAASSIEDDLLAGPIRDLTCWARESGVARRWFFIRYADPQPHIRLRFQGVPATLAESLLPKMLGWAQDLLAKDFCLRFAIDTYEREIERYGGDDAIDIAEDLFSIDSESVLTLLRFLGPRSPLVRVDLAVFGLNYLLDSIGCSVAQRLALLKDISAPRRESGPVYRERKGVLQALVGLQHNSALARIINEMSHAMEPNTARILDIGWRFRALDECGELTLPLNAIFRSFAHMQCNRLGLDVTSEKLAYGLLMRSYEALHAISTEKNVMTRPVEDYGM